jgi:hypothetical protein
MKKDLLLSVMKRGELRVAPGIDTTIEPDEEAVKLKMMRAQCGARRVEWGPRVVRSLRWATIVIKGGKVDERSF